MWLMSFPPPAHTMPRKCLCCTCCRQLQSTCSVVPLFLLNFPQFLCFRFFFNFYVFNFFSYFYVYFSFSFYAAFPRPPPLFGFYFLFFTDFIMPIFYIHFSPLTAFFLNFCCSFCVMKYCTHFFFVTFNCYVFFFFIII